MVGARRVLRGRVARVLDGLYARRPSAPASRPSSTGSRPRRGVIARQNAPQADEPGIPDSTRRRLLDLPSSIRQPPPGGLICARACSRRSRRRAPRRDGQDVPDPPPLGLRARRPEAFGGDHRPLDAGPRAFAYARGGAVIAPPRSPPAARRRRRGAAGAARRMAQRPERRGRRARPGRRCASWPGICRSRCWSAPTRLAPCRARRPRCSSRTTIRPPGRHRPSDRGGGLALTGHPDAARRSRDPRTGPPRPRLRGWPSPRGPGGVDWPRGERRGPRDAGCFWCRHARDRLRGRRGGPPVPGARTRPRAVRGDRAGAAGDGARRLEAQDPSRAASASARPRRRITDREREVLPHADGSRPPDRRAIHLSPTT